MLIPNQISATYSRRSQDSNLRNSAIFTYNIKPCTIPPHCTLTPPYSKIIRTHFPSLIVIPRFIIAVSFCDPLWSYLQMFVYEWACVSTCVLLDMCVCVCVCLVLLKLLGVSVSFIESSLFCLKFILQIIYRI